MFLDLEIKSVNSLVVSSTRFQGFKTITKCLFRLACGIIAAAEDSESYDTDDIEGQKIVSQSSVRAR